MPSQKRNMPSKVNIAKYWIDKLLETTDKFWLDVYIDLGYTKESLDTCFACGSYSGSTERAHIKAKHKGGSDSIENLHLLCKHCHLESENFSDDLYNEWFLSKNPLNSASHFSLLEKSKVIEKHFIQNKNCNCEYCNICKTLITQ